MRTTYVPPGSPVVTLYGRPGCHLCDVARLQLRAVQQTIPFHLEDVNIEGDADLERRFLLEIPVVAVAGEVVSAAPIDLDRVREAIVAARLGSTGRLGGV